MLPHLVDVYQLPDELFDVIHCPDDEFLASAIVERRRDLVREAREKWAGHPAIARAIATSEPCSHEDAAKVPLPVVSIKRDGRVCRFRGVSKSGDKWRVRHAFGGSLKSYGTYRTAVEAALAYDACAFANRGKNAVFNFPEARR